MGWESAEFRCASPQVKSTESSRMRRMGMDSVYTDVPAHHALHYDMGSLTAPRVAKLRVLGMGEKVGGGRETGLLLAAERVGGIPLQNSPKRAKLRSRCLLRSQTTFLRRALATLYQTEKTVLDPGVVRRGVIRCRIWMLRE